MLYYHYYTVADISTGRVGAPLICCEVRVRDWAEGMKQHIHRAD